jgi:hypothetical protein
MNLKHLLFFARKSFLFIIGFFVLAYLLELLIIFSVKGITIGEYGVLNKINEGKINAEILISGTSRALKAINPELISEKTGMSCFNIASDGSDLGVQLPKLKWYLNKNKKPKILIQDISQFGGEISSIIYEPFKYLPYVSDDSLYKGLLKIDEEYWIHKYISPTNLLYYNFDFYAKLFQELTNTFRNKDNFINGFLPDNSKWSSNFELYKKKNPDGINCSVSVEYENYLHELKDYCENQKIILVLTVLPNYYLLNEITKNATDVFKFYSKLENIPHTYYLNYVDLYVAHDERNFYNFTHLNLDGANKFSIKLASDLTTLLH